MSKLCKSCGNYYEGDHCDKCGYGDPNLKTHAADKYKKPTKPERFRTEEEKELYAEWEKEKKEDTEIKRHYDPNAGKKTLAIVAVVVIGVIVAVLYKSGVIFNSHAYVERDSIIRHNTIIHNLISTHTQTNRSKQATKGRPYERIIIAAGDTLIPHSSLLIPHLNKSP